MNGHREALLQAVAWLTALLVFTRGYWDSI